MDGSCPFLWDPRCRVELPKAFSCCVGILGGRLVSQMPRMGIPMTPMTSVTQRRKCLKVSRYPLTDQRGSFDSWFLKFAVCSVFSCLVPCLGLCVQEACSRRVSGETHSENRLCSLFASFWMNCDLLLSLSMSTSMLRTSRLTQFPYHPIGDFSFLIVLLAL